MAFLEKLPERVMVYEVGLRDGLQNEAAIVSTAGKLQLIRALIDAGVKHIEATSFVSPRWIPALADADELVPQLPRADGVVYSALVPNLRGLERARAAGIPVVAVFLSASETHTRKNVNKSIEQALASYAELCRAALAAGMKVRGYLSTVWGCPYEGKVAVSSVVRISEKLVEMGVYEVSLGDTIGVGTPLQTQEILQALEGSLSLERVALHLHDTRGTALANTLVGLEMGVRTFDSSVGGLGGCPYAPGAAGNLATEDLVYMLDQMGIETGIDLDRLVAAGELASELVGRSLPGKTLQAILGERRRAKA